jgi:RNA polymerase sigma-70 factor, ECF subfamily
MQFTSPQLALRGSYRDWHPVKLVHLMGDGGLEEWERQQCTQCLSCDGRACAALLKRHEPDIARQMWRFTRDRAVQSELVHEVFVEAYLSLRRYRPGKVPFLHWLRRIATRVGYQFWKREAKRKKFVPLEDMDFAAPVTESPDTAVAEALHKLLSRLKPPERLVLTLMYFEECGVEEIANRCGWNKAMVKMRAMRARKRLREMIVKGDLLDTFSEMIDGSAGSR